MKTILVATDLSPASERALEFAVGLAAAEKAHLALAHVIDGHVMMPSELWRKPSAEERAATDERVLHALHVLADKLGRDGVPIECVITHGEPREEIPRLAHQVDAQLIVMAQARCYMGSTVEKVLRDADVPVLIAPRADAQVQA